MSNLTSSTQYYYYFNTNATIFKILRKRAIVFLNLAMLFKIQIRLL